MGEQGGGGERGVERGNVKQTNLSVGGRKVGGGDTSDGA